MKRLMSTNHFIIFIALSSLSTSQFGDGPFEGVASKLIKCKSYFHPLRFSTELSCAREKSEGNSLCT